MRGRVGRHQSNSFKTILTDLSDRDIRLVNTNDLYDLRSFALEKCKRRELSKISNFLCLFSLGDLSDHQDVILCPIFDLNKVI